MQLPYWANFNRAKLFLGRNVRHQTKNLSLSPDKKSPPIKVKGNLVKVQVSLRG